MKRVEELIASKKIAEERLDAECKRLAKYLKENDGWAFTADELYDKFPMLFSLTPVCERAYPKCMCIVDKLIMLGVRFEYVDRQLYLYYGGD